MNPHPSSCSNGRSIRTRFARRFLRALKKIGSKGSSSRPSPRDISWRCRRVKIAADASMASAVGPRRVWSRTMLNMLRSRSHACLHASRLGNSRRPGADRHAVGKRKRLVLKRKLPNRLGLNQVNQLRRLVPGGEAMDLDILLDETAHYIKCLATQVKVMRSIVDYCSA
ncbi:hypothetical protein Nepgr_032821 [Nepenthes gracilis]|uniref:IBH1-like N-terminal domain-containing protein n=1 Tax=Nepenthes gracilis TaxID=150966 RepID=A0AAD3TJC9_NEPGR|nr:hypothetical protein Nepgr_032821 [Nepenthes gracilis]